MKIFLFERVRKKLEPEKNYEAGKIIAGKLV